MLCVVVEGRMCSRMYCVKMGRMELLFWKKEPAGLTNWNESMYSVDFALESVMQILRSINSPRLRSRRRYLFPLKHRIPLFVYGSCFLAAAGWRLCCILQYRQTLETARACFLCETLLCQ